METFSALLAICAGNSPVAGELPVQGPVTLSFDVFFYLRPNKRLGKQSWGWWFGTPSRALWRHCNGQHLRSPVHFITRMVNYAKLARVSCLHCIPKQPWEQTVIRLVTRVSLIHILVSGRYYQIIYMYHGLCDHVKLAPNIPKNFEKKMFRFRPVSVR